MKILRDIENVLTGWFDRLPHLPQNAQEWFAKHIWWLVAVWSVLGAIGAIGLFMALFVTREMLVRYEFDAALIEQATSPIGRANMIIVLIFYVIVVALAVYAVPYLKHRQKRGWTLLFIAALITAIESVILLFINLSLSAFIGNMFMTFVGLYILFEMRDYFKKHTKNKKK